MQLNLTLGANFHHGVSLLYGWLPITVEVTAGVLLLLVIGWRSRRWRLVWLPIALLAGVGAAAFARYYSDSRGLASDPAPRQLWIWVGLSVAALMIAILGWRGTRWWRRGLSVLVIPLCVLASGIVLDQWTGYFSTVQSAWSEVTAGPLPDQVAQSSLSSMRTNGTVRTTGAVVPVDIPDTASGFSHRQEFVYLPPIWFAGPTPPSLPVVMMVAGEFNTPADWMRTGNAIPTMDTYAAAHGGSAPILVFADSGGSFNNDTECVDGPRGNVADHLTGDVRPYVISQFGAQSAAADWGIVGWSMGGTCAVDLAVMHPELFSSFEDIAGDLGPTSGTKQQTIDRLYGGNAAAFDHYDPLTVMAAHGAYTNTSGWFEDSADTPRHRGAPGQGTAPQNGKGPGPGFGNGQRRYQPGGAGTGTGIGGRDNTPDTDQSGAAQQLCTAAHAVGIDCSLHTLPGGHTWQFASAAFPAALPWLAAKIHTPGSNAVL